MARTAAVVVLLSIGAVGLLAASAWAGNRVASATFDAFGEGAVGTSFSDGGITFFGLDRRVPDEPVPSTFTVERADATLSDFDGFTSPNALGFGGFVAGPDAAFTRVGEFRMSTGNGGKEARLELFESGTVPGNTVALEGLRYGRVMAVDSVTLLGGNVHHYTLSLAHLHGRFDELRVVGSGSTESGVFFAVIDSVRIRG